MMFLKFKPIFLVLIILVISASCIESKKEDPSVSSTGKKYFVTVEEIQVLNKLFVSQAYPIASEIIRANLTSIRVEGLLAGHENIQRLETDPDLANCDNFKERYIDPIFVSKGINCGDSTTNYCSNEVHVFEECSSNDLTINCENTFKLTDVGFRGEIDYSGYQNNDEIQINGWIKAIVNDVGNNFFVDSKIECNFSFTYKYGQTTVPNCSNTFIECNIDGNIASCSQVLDVGAGGTTVNSCTIQ